MKDAFQEIILIGGENMFETVQKLNVQATIMETTYWLSKDLFSFQWWIIVSLTYLF